MLVVLVSGWVVELVVEVKVVSRGVVGMVVVAEVESVVDMVGVAVEVEGRWEWRG